MRQLLYNKWFGDDDTQAIKDEEEEGERRGNVIRELVSREGFKVDVLEWLELTIEQHSPKPDTETGMAYQIGVSDGLKLVKQRLTALQNHARNFDAAI